MGSQSDPSMPSFESTSFISLIDGAEIRNTMLALTERLRDSRFQKHVSFDNFTGGDATEKNTNSFTLNVSHKGYQSMRHSRVFMVGIDENDYSDIALQWVLEELVDDGDEVVCLRVVDRDAKVASDKNVEKRQYRKEATDLLQRIKDKNDENRAISIVLEFAVGKVHPTFQKMVSLSQCTRHWLF